MATTTKTELKAALETAQQLQQQIASLEAAKAEIVTPLKAAYEKKIAKLVGSHNEEMAALQVELQACEKQVRDYLLSGCKDDGSIAVHSLVSDSGVKAEVNASSVREVEPSVFYHAVPKANRIADFWKCFKVQLGVADKYLGKNAVDKLATAKHSFSVKFHYPAND